MALLAQLRFCIKCFVVACSAWLLAASSASRADEFNEYQIKAIFLFNFAQFVEWSSPEADRPVSFVIGVLGDDPFGSFLDKTIEDEKIKNRPFVIKRYRSIEQISDCDILYISYTEGDRLKQALVNLKGREILTVSDAPNFAKLGGVVQFVTENRKIKLAINVDAARTANLTISSKLLRPATIVHNGSGS